MSSAESPRPLIYVCDPSAEATRIESALGQAGYDVVDVPRHRLVERVRLERPAAIVLDVVDESGLGIVSSIRATSGGEGVHVLFVATHGGPLRDAEDALMRDGSGLFLRPVDPTSLVRKIEALVGPGDLSRDRQKRARPNVANAPEDLPSGRSLDSAALPSASSREQALPELADDIRALLSAADARAAALDLSGAAPPLDGDDEIELILGAEDLVGIAPPEEAVQSDREVDDGRATTSSRGRSRGTSSTAPPEDERSITQSPLQIARQHRTTTSASGRTSTAPGYRTPPNVPAPSATGALHEQARSLRDAALAMPKTPSGSPPRGAADVTPTPSRGAPSSTRSAPPPSFFSSPPTFAFASAPPSALVPRSSAALPAEGTLPPRAPAPLEGIPPLLGPGIAPSLVAALVRERASGVLTFADETSSRAITLRDGDVSVVQSTHPDDNLVVLLERRGLLARDALGTLNLSPIPRLACAALVARGFLAQDDLWPSLRLYSEQVLSAMLGSVRGTVSFIAGRVAEDGPSPFGALTGSAVFVRAFLLARDVTTFASRAQHRPFKLVHGRFFGDREEALGGSEATHNLDALIDLSIDAHAVDALGPALPTLEALALLDIVCAVDALPVESERPPPTPLEAALADASLDADALRLRIAARRKLVDEGDYFSLLGVSPRAGAFEIRQAYLELRRTFEPARLLLHPELGAYEGDLRVILEVVEEAYMVLRDDARRDRYRRAIGLAS